jgi:hypothetical protein
MAPKLQEVLMSDPNAWQKGITDIVSEKNRQRDEAAKQARDDETHFVAEYRKIRDILRRQPQAAFEEFATFIRTQRETATVSAGWEDPAGPWIKVKVSDAKGELMSVSLHGRVGREHPRWFWVYHYASRRGGDEECEVDSSPQGPSKQYILEELSKHYQEASKSR